MSEEKKIADNHDLEIEDVDIEDIAGDASAEKKVTSKKAPEDWPVIKTSKSDAKPVDKSLDIPAFEVRQRKDSQKSVPKRENQNADFFDAYGRFIIYGLAALILVIGLVVVGIGLSKKEDTDPSQTSSAEQTQAPAESSTEDPVVDTSLKKEAVPELNILMNRYYDSLIACDVDTIHGIVEDDSAYTLEKLQKQREYIEDYLNITCYTKPGLNDGEYVLYVYSEIKFANIATAAPQLNHYYVNQTASGEYQLANGMLDNAKVDYMKQMDEDADVQALIDDVYSKLTFAMMSDETLNNLVQMLNNVPDDTTEAPTEEQETFYVDGELFYRVDETVYPKEEVRVRAKNSLESDVVGVLRVGDYVTRTGYSENWSQITYDGYTAYVYKGFLTTEKPE